MKENKYKPQVPDIMEAVFDAAYLIFDLVAGMLFFCFFKRQCIICALRSININPLRR